MRAAQYGPPMSEPSNAAVSEVGEPGMASTMAAHPPATPVASPPPEDQRGRRRGILAMVDHPLVVAFVATLGVLGALLIGSAIGSIATILTYIILALFVSLGLDPVVRRLERAGGGNRGHRRRPVGPPRRAGRGARRDVRDPQ